MFNKIQLMMTVSRWMVVVSLFVLVGCSTQIIANYDESTFQAILKVSKKVDLFFADLHRTPKAERKFDNYKQQYIDIEVDLNDLYFRNSMRPFNTLSTKQVENAIELWKMEEASHKKKDTIPNLLIKRHRQQFMKVFIAMAKGEEAKSTTTQ